MTDTPSIIARTQKQNAKKMQEGTLLTYTVVKNPPAGFGSKPRVIGLIELDDKTKVLGQLLVQNTHMLAIGQRVKPRMTLSRINEAGLRIYEVAYEVLVQVSTEGEVFRGYLLALTGPSGVGKSTVSSLLHTAFSDYVERVPILTTRAPKKGDDGEYRYLPLKQFLSLKENGDIIAATEIPSTTEERWYGYQAKDIEAIWAKGKIPVVVTEMHLLQGLADHYTRRSILSFGLLPPGSSKRTMLSHLLHRLRTRGRDSEESIQDRLKNAEKDLAFFEERRELFDDLVVNEDLAHVVDTLKSHVLGLGTRD